MYVRTTVPLKTFVTALAKRNDLSLADAAAIVWAAGRDALRAAPPADLVVPKTPGPKKRERLG